MWLVLSLPALVVGSDGHNRKQPPCLFPARIPHLGWHRLRCRCALGPQVVIRRLWAEGGDSSAVQDQVTIRVGFCSPRPWTVLETWRRRSRARLRGWGFPGCAQLLHVVLRANSSRMWIKWGEVCFIWLAVRISIVNT